LVPATRYVTTPGGHVAHRVFGIGPPDVLFITNRRTNLDVMRDQPSLGVPRPGRPVEPGRVLRQAWDRRFRPGAP
jgi:hypothetical protein